MAGLRAVSAVCAVMLALASGGAVARDRAAAPPAGQPIAIGTSYTLRSAVLQDQRQINVWLPVGYDRSQDRYPVVYLLDGGVEQDFQHIAGLGYLASLSWTFGPVIIVGIETKVRGDELTPPATDPRYITAFPGSGGAERFRRFIGQEVMPFVRGHFRTGDRRAVMGESLAGLFVIDTMLREPSLFDDYIAISPSLWWDDRRPLRHLADSAGAKRLSGARLYLAVADEGGTMQDGVDRLRGFIGTLPPSRITMRYADFGQSATHDTVYHRAAEQALRWMYPAPPYAGVTPWFMTEGAAPPPAPPAKR